MSDALAQRLDALRSGLHAADGSVDRAAEERAQRLLDRAGQRMLLSSRHTVAALAGATGSGKSSLFNALTGLELAEVGVRRPTTAHTQACVWDAEGVDPLLDWLEVAREHRVERRSVLDSADGHDPLEGLVLLDLPDHDSTRESHRLEVDRLVELADLLVWVVDPQKYADAALHERYLRPLAAHDAVTVVALNQVDRLPPEAVRACLADLGRLLREDGMAAPTVVAVSARTGEGVEELRGLLAAAVQRREAARLRLAADLDRVVEPLERSLGGPPGAVDRREREQLVEALSAAAGVPAVVRAVDRSVRHRSALATGWPVTRWARRLRPEPLRRLGLERGRALGRSSLPVPTPAARAQVDLAVRRVADAAAGDLSPEWTARVRAAARGGEGDLADALDRAVGSADLGVERGVWWWAPLRALQWLLAGTALVGLGWLALLALNAYLRLPEPPTPEVGVLPLPTLLAVGGVLGGLLVAAAGRLLARATGRRRARGAERALRAQVRAVAEAHVLEPVEAEVARWERARAELRRAAGR